MNAKDLMIGDWVSDKYGSIVQVKSITETGINFEVDREGVIYNGLDEDDIEPVPLTPEILKKNRFHWGFTSNDEDLSLSTGWPLDAKDEHWCLDEDECDGTIEVWFPNESDYGMIDVLNGYTHEFNRVVKEKLFVHTLQHALYECGLRQKIEL